MKFIWLASLAVSALAQTPLLTLSGNASRPNKPAVLQLTLSGTTGATIAGLQWTLSVPAGVTVSVVAGPASTAAGKSVQCSPPGTNVICLATGMNLNTFGDGIVATINFTPTVAGTVTFGLSGTLGASPAGDAVVVGPAVPFDLLVLSSCDVNGDGSTDVADVTAMVSQAVGKTSCDAGVKCTVIEVIRIVAAALGGACKI